MSLRSLCFPAGPLCAPVERVQLFQEQIRPQNQRRGRRLQEG